MDDETRRRLHPDLAAAIERTEAFAKTLIGQSEEAATDAAKEAGFSVRVAMREGAGFPLRANLAGGRVNLTIAQGVVIAAEAY